MNGSLHPKMKNLVILDIGRAPRFRASVRHGRGQVRFSGKRGMKPPRGRPRGGGGTCHKGGMVVSSPPSYIFPQKYFNGNHWVLIIDAPGIFEESVSVLRLIRSSD